MKKTIKLTLEATNTIGDYLELRDEMVEDLVNIEMDAPTPEIYLNYQDLLMEMFMSMNDEDLQTQHDKHIEFFEEEEIK
mgnify:FL=1